MIARNTSRYEFPQSYLKGGKKKKVLKEKSHAFNCTYMHSYPQSTSQNLLYLFK